MNRHNAVRIRTEEWMNEIEFQDAINEFGIEFTKGVCPELGYPVIWLSKCDERIFQLAKGELNIETNLRLWFDDGTQEISITEKNYKEYDSNLFYDTRTGIYDITQDEL